MPHASTCFASSATHVQIGLSGMLFYGSSPCIEVAVNGADDVCQDGENNSADALAAPRKPHKGCGVSRMQAKLAMAAQSGKLHHSRII